MEDNNEEKKENGATEAVKQEVKETVNEVKEAFKDADVKKEAKETKNFLVEVFKNPIQKIKDVATGSNKDYFKYALIILGVWVIAAFIYAIGTNISYNNLFFNTRSFWQSTWRAISAVIAPVLSIAVISVIVILINKDKKKSFSLTFSSITIAKIPVAIGAIIQLLGLFTQGEYTSLLSTNAILGIGSGTIISFIVGLCSLISTILTYFAIKELHEEKDDNTFIKKYVVIMGIYYVVRIILSFLSITI